MTTTIDTTRSALATRKLEAMIEAGKATLLMGVTLLTVVSWIGAWRA